MLQHGKDNKGQDQSYYVVYERRLSDKIEPYDWKIALMADEREFETLFDETTAKQASAVN